MTQLENRGRELLASPIQLIVETASGGRIPWQSNGIAVTKKECCAIGWRSNSKVGDFDVTLDGQAEFDGFVDFQVTLTAQRGTSVSDIRLEMPISKDVAKYSMGMGLKGGYRPERFDWKWDKQFNQDAFWIGDVNAGVQVSFRDENYSRPLNTNFYVEGLNWLVKNVGIDGLYIDDVAFDRTTMKRVRKVLDRGRSGALIDLHSANQYNPRDGYVNSANLYLEHFPYINRLWFGEYFDYNSSPDFWLIEVSGIPYGLMGEMLEKGGNPWRGMIYGMTSRLPWAGDPRAIWKLWDSFGMVGSKMIGYWSPNCPVKTDNPDVLATAYVKQGKALISLASWAPKPVECKVTFDWQSLGLNSTKVTIYAPDVKRPFAFESELP